MKFVCTLETEGLVDLRLNDPASKEMTGGSRLLHSIAHFRHFAAFIPIN